MNPATTNRYLTDKAMEIARERYRDGITAADLAKETGLTVKRASFVLVEMTMLGNLKRVRAPQVVRVPALYKPVEDQHA